MSAAAFEGYYAAVSAGVDADLGDAAAGDRLFATLVCGPWGIADE